MSPVLELGGHGNRFTRNKTAIPLHALIGQHGLVGSDNDIAFPSIVAIDCSIVNGHIRAIGHTLSNVELETTHGRHGFGSQSVKATGFLINDNISIRRSQGDSSDACSGFGARVLEIDTQINGITYMGDGWGKAVNRKIRSFNDRRRNCGNVRNALGSSHTNGDIAACMDRSNGDVCPTRIVHKRSTNKLTIHADSHV